MHQDLAAEVLNPMIIFPAASAALGLWVLVTGRPVNKWPSRLMGSKLRVWAACDLVASGAVIGLAAMGNSGLAFLLYAVSALALALATLRLGGHGSPRIG